MSDLPRDPVILLGVVNTELRDFYESLNDLCLARNIPEKELKEKLAKINYKYDADTNQFV